MCSIFIIYCTFVKNFFAVVRNVLILFSADICTLVIQTLITETLNATETITKTAETIKNTQRNLFRTSFAKTAILNITLISSLIFPAQFANTSPLTSSPAPPIATEFPANTEPVSAEHALLPTASAPAILAMPAPINTNSKMNSFQKSTEQTIEQQITAPTLESKLSLAETSETILKTISGNFSEQTASYLMPVSQSQTDLVPELAYNGKPISKEDIRTITAPDGLQILVVRAYVVRVIDGDTTLVYFRNGRYAKDRSVYINAPELKHPFINVYSTRPNARKAQLRSAEIYGFFNGICDIEYQDPAIQDPVTAGHEVWLERDTDDRDMFGRLLRSPYVQQKEGSYLSIELQLASEGLGVATEAPERPGRPAMDHGAPDVKHWTIIKQAYENAVAVKKQARKEKSERNYATSRGRNYAMKR